MDIKYNSAGLIPAIIQDSTTKTVLMLGYMNAEAVSKTLETNKVTFFSRSKQRLWTKGEESGHFLTLNSLKNDVITTPYSFRQLQKAQPAIKERIAVGGRLTPNRMGFYQN